MDLEQICSEWQLFLQEQFGIQDFLKKEVAGFERVQWIYPLKSCELTLGNLAVGCVFSSADSDRCTEGIAAAHGFMTIAGSRSGSNLIMDLAGEDPGCCKWIAPGWEYYDHSEFEGITTDFVGMPEAVFRELIEKGCDYYKDTDFNG